MDGKIFVSSEIADLEAVIIHQPGIEIENMTPRNAERALYSDILNLAIAEREYNELKETLKLFAEVYETKDLLTDVFKNEMVRKSVVNEICQLENAEDVKDYLLTLNAKELAGALIEGVEMKKDSLTKFLNPDRFELQPLHNFFYSRDASVVINDKVLISKMAKKVRLREAILMKAIFNYHYDLSADTITAYTYPHINDTKISFEGGDILVARNDTLLIGMGSRTTSQGIDFILNSLLCEKHIKNIIVQELPKSPESFIHLDMVFTFADKNQAVVYAPVIFKANKYQTFLIRIDRCKGVKISEEENIFTALKKLKIDVEPIFCGGKDDSYIQEREQWHSGANFFALGPGKIIGYERNIYTIEELNKHGFEVVKASDLISGKVKKEELNKFVITIQGAELSRGGGGARCMTMPLKRKADF